MRETPENTGDDLETTEDCCLYTIDHFRKRLLCEKGGGLNASVNTNPGQPELGRNFSQLFRTTSLLCDLVSCYIKRFLSIQHYATNCFLLHNNPCFQCTNSHYELSCLTHV